MAKQSQTFLRAKALCGKYLPWCQDDPEELGQVVQRFIYEQEAYRRRWAQRWYENFQFIFGNSNIRWSRKYDFAVDADFLNRSVTQSQRASTNVSWVVAEALASMLYSNLPSWLVETAEEGFQKGKRFAKIYEKILDCYMQRLCCDKEFAQASLVFVAMGNVAARIDYDEKAGNILELPVHKKQRAPIFTDFLSPNPVTQGLLEVPTPALDMLGRPLSEDRWQPQADETGKQQINRVTCGDVAMGILTPFEYMREMGSAGMHKTKFIDHIRLMDYDEYLYRYSNLDGKTREFDQFKPLMKDQQMFTFAMRHFMQLMFTTPPNLEQSDSTRKTESIFRSSHFRHKVLVVEHFDRPHDEMWPEGRRVVVVNGRCTHVTAPQYRIHKLGGWHPFVEAQWMPLRPSSISCGPMDTVTAKNRELNLFDSLIATAGRRTMGTHMLARIGSGVDPHKWTGEPGQTHLVNDLECVRFIKDENPIPAVIPEIRRDMKEDVYDGSGAGDALRGERSKGVSTGYAIRQLTEREEKRLTPPRKAMQYFVAECGEKIAACLKQNAIALGDDVVGFLKRSAAGEFQIDDIVAFMTSSVEFGVDIRVKEDSIINKSKATKQADILELIKNPKIQERLNDAEVMDELLEYFDADKLRDASAAHRERAHRENQIFADFARLGPNASGIKSPVVVFEDDDNIHLGIHQNFFVQNADEILSNEPYLTAFLLHEEQHRIQSQEKEGLVMPGTAVQLPQMFGQVRSQPPPGIPMIAMASQQRAQMQQQQAQQGQAGAPSGNGQRPGERRNAQAPSQPAPVGSKGPPQISTSAPSKNTPSATAGRAA